jgi:peptidoglycan/LPS O-acetylase OafA/YrhL
MLLADFYCCTPLKLNNRVFFYSGLALAFLLPLLISIYSLYAFMLKFLLIILLFASVLFNEELKKALSRPVITIIGGMCYSIYLLHFMVLSAFSFVALEFVPLPSFSLAPFFIVMMIALVLLVSAVFFKLVEQPFMKFRTKKKMRAPAAKNSPAIK